MIEMLGVLAIIGVLSVGGIAGYSQAMSKFKVSKTTDQIQTMVTNIRTLFAGQRTYKGLAGDDGKSKDFSTAYTMGILTDETWDQTNKLASNAYGGSIVFTTPNSHHNFAITYNGLPQDACTRMVMSDWGDASSGLVGLVVSGAEQKDGYSAGDVTFATAKAGQDGGFPVNLTDAVTACQKDSGGADNTASITWVYR